MQAGGRHTTLLITCGAIAREITAILNQNALDFMKVECLPAHLHNTPQQIPEAVCNKIRRSRDRFQRIIVLYADCGTGGKLDAVLDEEGVERIPGAHCYELFAGHDDFADIMDADGGTFFLTDFLARHFERLVWQGLGLDKNPKLSRIYFSNYTRLLYLAQSDDPKIRRKAEQAAEKLGLRFEIRHTGYGGYEAFLTSLKQSKAALDQP
ncbi:MAG TPA: hypothetical protein DG761_08055 [Gammaproteobacteria bacterium]|jgi:hypothetical protein|nr:hypothetical protein [Acidiferrobacteraceae bacterium]MDP6398790.1 DUF1638 domain-containing protein [Arenicellales bacterium]MDP6551180.1 DUF1638 domain-containing protein [Arenicellales bacterium]MDP6918980.1 DUF1638 domain-containing protein [Arenicellales bacterium]HCX87965.1 hypothetical protein [Gammaproteobacteria bacterium]|tara:strand:- start:29050 stop:29676 length:627 start_codon:yes stop_codon:yes gene_type:complete